MSPTVRRPKSGFGERLRSLIHGRQKKFAAEVGISESHLSQILAERRTPSPLLVKRLADVLGVREEWLLTGKGPQRSQGVPDRDQEIALVEIPREDINEHHRGRVVPIVGRIAAGDTIITTDEAEQFLPGDADAFVLFENAPPHAFAVRVVGDSMDPPYRSGDIVIADGDRPVRHGLAVVVFEEDGFRLARLKIMHVEPEEVLLLSTNPAFPPMRLPRQAVAGAWTVIAHLRRNNARQ